MQLINKMNRDGPLRASEWNKMVDAVRAARILPSAVIRPTYTSVGTILNGATSGKNNVGATAPPWMLSASPDPEADPDDKTPPHIIRVAPGLFNNLLAPEWNDEWSVQYNSKAYAKIEVTTDGKSINSIKIVINTTVPTVHKPKVDGLETKIDVLFGLFYKGGTYNTLTGHLVWNPKLWFVETKTGAPVGQPPYNFWWKLVGNEDRVLRLG